MGQKLVTRATYWRRRVVVLAAAVVVLGLPIWAVNQALGGSQAPRQGSPRSHPGRVGHVADPAHSRSPGQPPTRETAGLGSRPRARPSAAPRDASTAPSPRSGRQTCTRRAVRLTLRTTQHRYGPGQQVTFVIGAATKNRPCRVDLGPRFTSVVVASAGTPLWDSSSCLRGTGSQVVMLKRGAPGFLQVAWDRRTSLSGCPGQGTTARAGTYTAAAFNGQLRSPATTFVLSGRGPARP
jgi:hypothetical protein